jgi:hypothetical protein
VEFGEKAEPTMAVLQSEVVTTMMVDLLAPTMAVLQSKAPTMAVDLEAADMSVTCRADTHVSVDSTIFSTFKNLTFPAKIPSILHNCFNQNSAGIFALGSDISFDHMLINPDFSLLANPSCSIWRSFCLHAITVRQSYFTTLEKSYALS